jgi:hypothetical protein
VLGVVVLLFCCLFVCLFVVCSLIDGLIDCLGCCCVLFVSLECKSHNTKMYCWL